jgi:hypothetical protein
MSSGDLDELLNKCKPVIDPIDPIWLMRLSVGAVPVEVIELIVACMGRVAIDIGDGLTLLHIAGQCNRPDWVEYLVGEKQHPVEAKTVHGETPLDQAAWRGHMESSVALLK